MSPLQTMRRQIPLLPKLRPSKGIRGHCPSIPDGSWFNSFSGPSVDARRQSKLWPVLLRDEVAIRSRMHDLFLEVVIDHEQKVAFTRQVVSEDLDVPILLRKASLTFLETALLLFLRQRLTQADAQGERAVVSREDMQEHLAVFEKENNPDHAKFARQVVNAVDKAKKLSLLQSIRGSGSATRSRQHSSSCFPPRKFRSSRARMPLWRPPWRSRFQRGSRW